MPNTYTRDDLEKMNHSYIALVEKMKITELTEKIKVKVLNLAQTSLQKSYQWFPNSFDASYLVPPPAPSKRILIEVCKKLQLIFVDSDIRIIENSIFISWF
jgi:hypothetical protein